MIADYPFSFQKNRAPEAIYFSALLMKSVLNWNLLIDTTILKQIGQAIYKSKECNEP